MRKMMIVMVASLTLLQGGASYKPLIDSNGQSGTFNESQAKNITNDKMLCSQFAKDNTTKISNISYWIFSPKMETRYKAYYRKCLSNRGHSVIN